MRFFSCIILFFLVCAQGVAQPNLILKGRVVDAKSRDPIAYANIGIPEKYIGTAANEEGFFTLKLPAATRSDTLHISAIGFKKQRFLVSQFAKQKNHIIFLPLKTYQMQGVSVSGRKLKTSWIGKNVRPIPDWGAFGMAYSGKHTGASYAFKIKWDKSLPIRVLHTRMYLSKNYNKEPVKLRCRIASVDSATGLPGQDLIHHNVIESAKDRGWVTCDFLNKDMNVDDPVFFVIFELLRDSANAADKWITPLFSLGLFFNSELYIRHHAMGRWIPSDMDLIYSVKVEY